MGAWRDAVDPPEGGGELARAAKAAGQGNLSEAQPPIRHQLLGVGNSAIEQITMWRITGRLLKGSAEMRWAEPRNGGQL